VNPVQTELENVVCDWIVDALNLPDKFYLKNLGGGTISTTVSDSVFLTVHSAKRRKLLEIGANERDPRVLKLVAYYSESAHSSSIKGNNSSKPKALHMKDIPYSRAIPLVYNEKVGNFEADVSAFEK
jgi:hypothetical protein